MAKRKRKDPLVWGVLLLIIGLIFLLHNFDIGVWDSVARLWPIVLIVWGAWKMYYGIKERQEKSEKF